MNQKNMNELLMAIIAIPAILVVACAINNLVSGQSTSVVNITEFDALDRMRYTAMPNDYYGFTEQSESK